MTHEDSRTIHILILGRRISVFDLKVFSSPRYLLYSGSVRYESAISTDSSDNAFDWYGDVLLCILAV